MDSILSDYAFLSAVVVLCVLCATAGTRPVVDMILVDGVTAVVILNVVAVLYCAIAIDPIPNTSCQNLTWPVREVFSRGSLHSITKYHVAPKLIRLLIFLSRYSQSYPPILPSPGWICHFPRLGDKEKITNAMTGRPEINTMHVHTIRQTTCRSPSPHSRLSHGATLLSSEPLCSHASASE